MSLRDFPSVEIAAGFSEFEPYLGRLTRPFVIAVIKDAIAEMKEKFSRGDGSIGMKQLIAAARKELDGLVSLDLTAVINGTGIAIHTNLGRSPLAKEMIVNAMNMVTGYSNLEFDLKSGNRGKRGILIEKLLASLCETESATLVNNNAAALFILLNTLANRREVIISRGELVQIGGGFKIPEIMTRAGVKLIEVGTTNRTSLTDYADAITDRTRMILKVHRSNFVQKGFVEETSIKDIADLCRERGLVSVNDLGSGLIAFPQGVPITDEPNLRDSVRAGADITCFSGDKLLGACQAGLIVGKGDLVAKIKKNPLFRTMRCDKIVFSILSQVLKSYLDGTQNETIPIWKMISLPVLELKKRGEAILEKLPGKDIVLKATQAYLGGGSTPDQTIPSLALSIRTTGSANKLARSFREHTPPIIGRVENDEFLIDLRTIFPEDDELIVSAITGLVD